MPCLVEPERLKLVQENESSEHKCTFGGPKSNLAFRGGATYSHAVCNAGREGQVEVGTDDDEACRAIG